MNRDEILLMAKIGKALYDSNLVGNQSPNVERRWKRMNAIRPGDLVIELSTSVRWASDGPERSEGAVINAIGYLEKVIREPVQYDEPWDEVAEGRPIPTEECFYINRLLDGASQRWTNADFCTIYPVEGWWRVMNDKCL